MRNSLSGGGLVIGLALFLIASVAIFLQDNFEGQSMQQSAIPTPLQACLIDACAARRAQEKTACEGSPGGPAGCAGLLDSSVSANACNPSRFPPAGSVQATAIENAYTSALGACYSVR